MRARSHIPRTHAPPPRPKVGGCLKRGRFSLRSGSFLPLVSLSHFCYLIDTSDTGDPLKGHSADLTEYALLCHLL